MNTTTILKNYTFCIIFLLSLIFKVDAQQVTEPEACKNPPKGYEKGGDFSPNVNIACISSHPVGTSTIVLSNPLGIDPNSQEYIFNYKDGDSLTFTKENKFTATKEGILWIMQRGIFTENGISKNVLSCKSIEVIKTEVPEVEISTCGPKTINILIKDNPISQKQSGYQVQYDWDFIIIYEKTHSPFLITFTHPTGDMPGPTIHAFYERDKRKVCYSSAVQFSAKKSFPIKGLQSQNFGKEVKIQMEEGETGKEYYIQYKAKTAAEWIESKTRIKRNEAEKLGEATIIGLEPTTQYCFRLAEKDTCNYAVAYSNEMCITYIPPTPPFISQLEGLNEGKEAKLSMKNVVSGKQYAIQYRLKSSKDWVDSSVKIKRVADLGEAILSGLETNKSYCFRIIERDSASKTEIISNEICSIALKSTLLSSKNVRLQWTKPDKTDTRLTTIAVMDENGNSVSNLDFGEISDTTFIHNELNCLNKYKFSVVLKSVNNNAATVKSPQILVDPKSLLTPPNLQSVDVVSVGPDNQPFYDAYVLAPMPKYEIYRSTNGGQMIKVGEDKNASFADKNLDTGSNYYCYAHKYINECGNTSELSRKTCTIKLSSEPLGVLTWSPFKVYADNDLYKVAKTEYVVQIMDTLNNTIDYLDPIRDTTTIIVEEKYGTAVKYKVRANVLGYINFGLETRQQEISSYSNTVAPYLVLSNESPKTHLTVFPNPGEDKVRINSSGVPVRFVELFDIKGRLIYKGEIADDTFNLSAFEKGKYILRLYDSNKKLLNTKNIVKW